MRSVLNNPKLKRYLMYALVAMFVAMAEPVLDRLSAPQQRSSELQVAWEQRLSKVWVTTQATVIKNLPDDRDGSRHQRFLINAGTGQSVLVAHNIDLAERAPVQRGDSLKIRGRYEWNERGGVIHWTHHDPSGRIEGGWLEVSGERFR